MEPCFLCEKGYYQAIEGQKSCLQCSLTETTSGEGSNSSVQCGGVYLTTAVSVCCLLYQAFEIHVYLTPKEMRCDNNPRERLLTDKQASPSCASDWLKAVAVTGMEIWALTLPHIMGRWCQCRIRCYYLFTNLNYDSAWSRCFLII